MGTTGITIPMLINERFDVYTVAIGLITIVVSNIGYNASEKIMQLVDANAGDNKKELFMNLAAIVLALLFTIVVCIRTSNNHESVIWISVLAYILSSVFWWFQNRDNSNLEPTTPTSPLGGSEEQFN